MAKRNWDDDERRWRGERDRDRRGRQSWYAREGYHQMTGNDPYERDRGFGPGRGGYEERRGMAYSGDPTSGEGGYGWRPTDDQERHREYGRSYGGPDLDHRDRAIDPHAPWPPTDRGYVGFGPSQAFWRSPDEDDYRARERGREAWVYRQDRGVPYRARDEMSRLGSDEAERRSEAEVWEGGHRGRGPRGYTRSDERIREDVSDRLTDDAYIDASEIDVQVGNGEVTLNGTVRSRWQKRRAEDIAEDISGVRHVQNNLRVQDWSQRAGEPTMHGAGAGRDRSAGGRSE